MFRIPIFGLALFLLFSAGVAFAQPPGDTIDIDPSDDQCSASVFWNDRTDVSRTLQVSINNIFQPDVLIDDIVGNNSRTLASYDLAPGNHTIRATLRDPGNSILDQEQVTVFCGGTTPSPTPVPPTATPTAAAQQQSVQVSQQSFTGEQICEILGGRWLGFCLDPSGHSLSLDGLRASEGFVFTSDGRRVRLSDFVLTPDGRLVLPGCFAVQAGCQQQASCGQTCTQQQIVQVVTATPERSYTSQTIYTVPNVSTLPSQSVIKAPNTGDGGLLR